MATKAGLTWQAVLMDIDRATEYAGDDADRVSALVDLGFDAGGVMIQIPAIDSAVVSLLVQRNGLVATVPVGLHHKKPADDATALWATTAGTGSLVIHVPVLGGIRYLRITTAAVNQTADRTFYVKGTV